MRDIQLIVYLFLCVFLSGCSVVEGPPAEHSGFLKQPEQLQETENLPVDAIWISDTFKERYDDYTKIIIRPINTEFVLKTSDWKHIKIKSEEEIKEDTKEIADYAEQELKKALAGGRVPRMTLVESPGPNTLILEVALVELIPTDVVRNAAGNVAGFFVPGGGLVSTGAGGRIAFEGRISDGETNQVLMKSKNHRVDKIAPVNLAGLTPYRHIRHNIDDLVDLTVEFLNSPLGTEIEGASVVTLSPW